MIASASSIKPISVKPPIQPFTFSQCVHYGLLNVLQKFRAYATNFAYNSRSTREVFHFKFVTNKEVHNFGLDSFSSRVTQCNKNNRSAKNPRISLSKQQTTI